jgi:hypothetical protein
VGGSRRASRTLDAPGAKDRRRSPPPEAKSAPLVSVSFRSVLGTRDRGGLAAVPSANPART